MEVILLFAWICLHNIIMLLFKARKQTVAAETGTLFQK